ncbi:hypothetical protein [Pseudotamlana carrageenivorans]|nr:hypothetical protein [Tamlana carrageenivorans]
MKNIIITGKQGSGKTFLGEKIAETSNSVTVRFNHPNLKKAFKGVLKKIEEPIDCIIIEEFAPELYKEKHIRYLLDFKLINLVVITDAPKEFFKKFNLKNFRHVETSY